MPLPTLDNVRISQTAKDVASIRQSVMATECGNRRRAAQAVATALPAAYIHSNVGTSLHFEAPGQASTAG